MAIRVCIIGAGISGLRCAAVLVEHGVQVVILEARDRVGGRVAQSNKLGPMEVDIGANWVHSTGDNPIIKLAKETNTPFHEWRQDTLIVDGSGSLVPRVKANSALATVWEIVEEAIEYSRTSTSGINPSSSLYDFFVQRCSSLVQAGAITQEHSELVLSMSEMWGAYVGDPVDRQSLKFFFMEDCIEGSDCFIPSNYKKIMAKIAAPALEKADVRLNTIMTSLTSRTSDFQKQVRVKNANGLEEGFDAAVVTAPLGWLKRHKDAVQPLSERISQAIDGLSYGNLEKVLIEFPFAFWDVYASTSDSDKDCVSFVHWLSPKYTSATNPQSWRLECVNFNAFSPPYRRSLLLFYTFGDCSRHLTSLIHGKEVKHRFKLLRDFFEPYYSRLPNYDAKYCVPQQILATEWSRDEFSGFGSYSNFQVGATDAAGDVVALRYGMPEHSIYFAGEHTAPFDGLGTVAGAYASGEDIAHRILNALEPQAKDSSANGLC